MQSDLKSVYTDEILVVYCLIPVYKEPSYIRFKLIDHTEFNT